MGQALRGFVLLRLPSSVPDLIGESLMTTLRWLMRLGPNSALVAMGLGLLRLRLHSSLALNWLDKTDLLTQASAAWPARAIRGTA